MKRKWKICMAAAIAAVVLAAVFVYFYWQPAFECGSGNRQCTQSISKMVDDCIPSVSVIKGENITLMINITREGSNCIVTEKVIESSGSEANLTGFENTCSIPYETGGEDMISSCRGSLYDYVAGEGGGGSQEPSGKGIPQLECQRGDDECKGILYDYITNCVSCNARDVELKWEPEGYWTRSIDVENRVDECYIYIEILNAVNIPPGEPSDIIGMQMFCNIPMSEIPLEEPTGDYCYGRLFEYLTSL